jgi:hypothetical protein
MPADFKADESMYDSLPLKEVPTLPAAGRVAPGLLFGFLRLLACWCLLRLAVLIGPAHPLLGLCAVPPAGG